MNHQNPSLELLRRPHLLCAGIAAALLSISHLPAEAAATADAVTDTSAQRVAGAPESGILELGNGRFQVRLNPAVGTTPPDWLNGAVEWEYAGQAVYLRNGERQKYDNERSYTVPEDDGVTDVTTRLLRSEMEDEHGRVFRVRSVDRSRLEQAIELYNQRVAATVGLERFDDRADEAAFTDAEPASGSRFIPLGWNRSDQDGDGADDRFLWDSDDRTEVTSPLTVRQEKAVVYFFGDSGTDGGMCSGVLVDDYFVLTAMHCAKDSSGSAWIYADGAGEARRGKVCTRGNFYSGADCANVTARWGNGSWGGSGDQGDDLVVMKIDEPLGLGNWMALSQASNSTLKSFDAYNLGHPGLTPTGANNIRSCTLFLGDPVGGMETDSLAPCESKMYWSNDVVNKTSNKVIGTKVDMSSGHSGGAIYYYPNGVSPTASHFLTGIVSGHHQSLTKSYNGGPKIPYHRSWILGVIAAN